MAEKGAQRQRRPTAGQGDEENGAQQQRRPTADQGGRKEDRPAESNVAKKGAQRQRRPTDGQGGVALRGPGCV